VTSALHDLLEVAGCSCTAHPDELLPDQRCLACRAEAELNALVEENSRMSSLLEARAAETERPGQRRDIAVRARMNALKCFVARNFKASDDWTDAAEEIEQLREDLAARTGARTDDDEDDSPPWSDAP